MVAAPASRGIRVWLLIHTWSSLIATVFLLWLCITGLPLVFRAEIERALDPPPARAQPAPGSAAASIDSIVAAALATHPDDRMVSLWFRIDDGLIVVESMAPSAPSQRPHTLQTFDLHTGQRIEGYRPDPGGVMDVVESLHKDLYIGLPGSLFLGAMGLMLLAAIVSGVVLYAPFMRRLGFATVRRQSGPRVKWLDLHNLLGIVTVVWLLVVGITGSINTLHDPVAGAVRDRFRALTASYRDAAPPQHFTSIDAAIAKVRAVAPGTALTALWYPGTRFSTPHHYAVFMHGSTPLTARMLSAALVDAETGALTDRPEMPWYAKALFVSQPLHFGDYGGLPLKIIWAFLDIVTIVVLGSGLYLWLGRRFPALIRRRPVRLGA